MFPLERALDLTNHYTTDDEENFSIEDENTNDRILPKKTTYDSGFVDTSDENNSSIMVKQEHHYHSTPLRPQQIHTHIRHPSTSSSRSSTTLNDKESRNTRFLGSRAVTVLNQWFQSNREYPYPDDERTDILANEAGITQKQVKKWFANKRVRSQLCYKPLYRSRKARDDNNNPPPPQTNYNYIVNHNNIAASSPSNFPPTLFNPMATSMMMFMMQQHFMMTAGANLPQAPTTNIVSPPPPPKKVDRINRFWL